MTSGPRVEASFIEGWAVKGYGAAHYFRAGPAAVLSSLCWRASATPAQLFERGDWRRCQLCERALAKEPSRTGAPSADVVPAR